MFVLPWDLQRDFYRSLSSHFNLPLGERFSSSKRICSTILTRSVCSMDISRRKINFNLYPMVEYRNWMWKHFLWCCSNFDLNEYDEQIVKRVEFHYCCFHGFDCDLEIEKLVFFPKNERRRRTDVFVEPDLLRAFFDDNHQIIVASFVVFVWKMFSDWREFVMLIELAKRMRRRLDWRDQLMEPTRIFIFDSWRSHHTF